MLRRAALLLLAAVAAGCAGEGDVHAVAGPVAFVGDSITAFQDWEETFPDLEVTNEGVANDTAAHVLARLDPIVAARPRAVFLLVGTNDLSFGVPTARTVDDVDRILERFAEDSPATALFLESVMPRQPEWAAGIRALNRRLRPLAERHGATWIDLWPALAAPDGSLRPEYTDDGLHLSERGKGAWANRLRRHVEAALV